MIERMAEVCARVLPGGLGPRLRESEIFNRITARHLALTSKRLDLCSAQIAHVLHLSGLSGKFPVRGKVCVEIGSGWVLSHAIVLYLLGAKSVIATDKQRFAYPSALRQSVHRSATSIIRDVLSPFEEHGKIRARLDKLLAIKTLSFDVLEELGVKYVAPIDLALRPLNTRFDFVFSFSVLEHVPINSVSSLLKNLASDLSDEGKMIHCVHLEDHKDIVNAPFDFLCESGEKFTGEVQGNRGNRIRRSQWIDILSQSTDMEFRLIYEWIRRDKGLPTEIDPSIRYVDDEDLVTSHIGVFGTRKGKETQL